MFVIFDFDGVVIDSHPAVREAVDSVHRYLNLDAPSDLEVASWVGPSIRQSAQRMQRELSLTSVQSDTVEKLYFDTLVDRSPDVITAFPGIVPLLDHLKSAGVPYALATMKSQAEMNSMARPIAAIDRFDVVVAPATHMDDTTKSELVAKAAAQLGAEGRGFMVGDRASDIEAGRSNGLTTVAVTWGAGTAEELASAGPDHTVTTTDELRRLLVEAA